jgi:hypothetical protein
MLDLRWPMGLMFALVGTLLAIYGAVTSASDMYKLHSLGININLWWGLALLAFGLLVLAMARWAAAKDRKQDKP